MIQLRRRYNKPVRLKSQLLTHWKIIGHNMTASSPVLSPNNILRTSAPHCAFIPNWRISKSCYFSFLPSFFKQNCVSLKFCTFKIALNQGVSVEVVNVPENKVFSFVRDTVIFFFFWSYVRRRTPFMWPSNFVFFCGSWKCPGKQGVQFCPGHCNSFFSLSLSLM